MTAPSVSRARSTGVHRLAVALAAATLLLIVAGGLVTNTGSALAVPDWPTTFGHNPFLFPWSRMVGGVFYEHSHRLLGAGVGFLTLALAGALGLGEPRGWVRALGLLALGAVGVQGLLGGLRVLWLRDTLAIVHGALAQAFFALTVALAVVTGPRWAAPAPVTASEARGVAPLALAAVGALYLQIVLGAFATHAGWIRLHLLGAVLAGAVAAALVHRLRARPARAAWGTRGGVLAALLALQVALGGLAFVARFTGLPVPGASLGTLLWPVAHRTTGALLLGTVLLIALEAGRARWAGCGATRALAAPRPASGRVLA